jgi:hypothetical protein
LQDLKMKSKPVEIVRTDFDREAAQGQRGSPARGRDDAAPAAERVIAGYDGPAGLASIIIPGIAAIVLAGVVSQTFARTIVEPILHLRNSCRRSGSR